MHEVTSYTYLNSPLGKLLLTGRQGALAAIYFPCHQAQHPPRPEWRHEDRPFQTAIAQLRAYFAGELREFDVPLALGGRPFEHRVWQALTKIPFGETVSYGQIAAQIGQPTACRAVGLANGRNPLPIIVPCHRVIGANGSLTGYGGGLDTKRRLLAHESVELPPPRTKGPRKAIARAR